MHNSSHYDDDSSVKLSTHLLYRNTHNHNHTGISTLSYGTEYRRRGASRGHGTGVVQPAKKGNLFSVGPTRLPKRTITSPDLVFEVGQGKGKKIFIRLSHYSFIHLVTHQRTSRVDVPLIQLLCNCYILYTYSTHHILSLSLFTVSW